MELTDAIDVIQIIPGTDDLTSAVGQSWKCILEALDQRDRDLADARRIAWMLIFQQCQTDDKPWLVMDDDMHGWHITNGPVVDSDGNREVVIEADYREGWVRDVPMDRQGLPILTDEARRAIDDA